MKEIHINGKNKGNIRLYALSTCVWCKKTKEFLNKLGVAYTYIDVDLLPQKEQDIIDIEVKKWNPRGTYPTIVIDNKKSVTGFREDEIKEALRV
jgi:glutaredoxin